MPPDAQKRPWLQSRAGMCGKAPRSTEASREGHNGHQHKVANYTRSQAVGHGTVAKYHAKLSEAAQVPSALLVRVQSSKTNQSGHSGSRADICTVKNGCAIAIRSNRASNSNLMLGGPYGVTAETSAVALPDSVAGPIRTALLRSLRQAFGQAIKDARWRRLIVTHSYT